MAALRYRRLLAVSIYGGMNVLSRGTTTILALIYALRLSPHELGIYAVVVSIAEVAGIVGDAGLSQAVMRTYYDRHNTPGARDYLSGIVFSARLIGAGVLVVLGVAGYFLWPLLTANTISWWPYLILAFLIAFFQRIGLMMDSLCQALEKPVYFGLFRSTQTAATFIFAILFVFVFRLRIEGAFLAIIAALVLANVLRVVTIDRVLGLQARWPSRAELSELLAYGVPLLPKQLAIWGRQMAMRLVLAHLVPLAQVGAFFLANAVASTVVLATTALEPAFSPFYFKKRVGGEGGFRERVLKFTTVLLALMTPIYVAGILLVGDVARFVLPVGYAKALPLIPIMFTGLFFQIQQPFMIKQLLFHKKTGMVSAVTIIPTVIALAALPAAVQWGGLAAAAWSMAIANVITLVAAQVAILRYESSDYPVNAALLFSAIVLAASYVVTLRGAASADLVEFALRAATVLAVALLCWLIWLWPNRNFIRKLVTA